MKNNKLFDSNNKKGFYTALFSVVCLAAVIVGVNGLNKSGKESKPQDNVSMGNTSSEDEELYPVDVNKNAPAQLPQVKVDENQANEFTQSYDETSNQVASSQTSSELPENIKPQTKPIEEEVAFNESVDSEETGSFDNKLTLKWPVAGDVVMDYSIDQAIYDVTLDQYRTNDSVCIGAEKGTVVKAAGDGIVELVANDAENGNMIVINHNNGWKTTYSQLEETVLVNEGENVKIGQDIGSVGSPSIYGISLGDHLEFKVTKEEASVDPKIALAE